MTDKRFTHQLSSKIAVPKKLKTRCKNTKISNKKKISKENELQETAFIKQKLSIHSDSPLSLPSPTTNYYNATKKAYTVTVIRKKQE